MNNFNELSRMAGTEKVPEYFVLAQKDGMALGVRVMASVISDTAMEFAMRFRVCRDPEAVSTPLDFETAFHSAFGQFPYEKIDTDRASFYVSSSMSFDDVDELTAVLSGIDGSATARLAVADVLGKATAGVETLIPSHDIVTGILLTYRDKALKALGVQQKQVDTELVEVVYDATESSDTGALVPHSGEKPKWH